MQNGLKTLLNFNQRSRLREANWTQTGKNIILYRLNYLLYMTPYTLEAAMQILSVYDSYT